MTEANRQVLDGAGVASALDALATQILERGSDLEHLAVIGIRRRGAPMAERLCARIAARTGQEAPRLGILDITLYRDDLTLIADQPVVSGTEIPFPIDGLRVVLIDDVLFTGRTTRAAIDALFAIGRPAKVELAVLVDRGHRELPFAADYVAVTVETTPSEQVLVHLAEIDGDDLVEVVRREGEA